ncbi:hypothetical protein ACQZ6C_20595 [Rhizobium rhizogenes]|uniref:hypothetical protein n=1 Tax=Rhizobium rhizogenes TaxID=359 RepID=UPI0015738FC6|nr:hypothetical protein [Rhizobium rhizogenes]NTF89369.1 hypothetical protein [Rhizobium rhizogenes]
MIRIWFITAVSIGITAAIALIFPGIGGRFSDMRAGDELSRSTDRLSNPLNGKSKDVTQ